jgi:hypothetical protein
MKTSFTGNGHNKPFCPILLENTTFVKGLVQVKGLSPTGEKAPQGNFCHERQKSPKTPVETNGFNTSFARAELRQTLLAISRASVHAASFRWCFTALTLRLTRSAAHIFCQ